MLVEFSVSNFRSFRDTARLSMLAAPLRANDSGMEEENVFEAGGLRLLKSKAIYGQNASGKSNLTSALNAFNHMVFASVEQRGLTKVFWNERFGLLKDWDNVSINFEATFLSKNILYRYGFSILAGVIYKEWLFGRPNKQEIKFFTREGLQVSIGESNYKDGLQYVDKVTGQGKFIREDSLFLTAVSAFGDALSGQISGAITGMMIMDGLNDRDAAQVAMEMMKDEQDGQVKHGLSDLLQVIGAGINGLTYKEYDEDVDSLNISTELKSRIIAERLQMIQSQHIRFDEEGNIFEIFNTPFASWESQGTKKMLSVGALLLIVLNTGSSLIIDEFDARLHPTLTLKILQLFHSNETNPNNAQFIFVTHDTGLLRRAKLRRDQICLVDKDRYGISTLRTLIEYKGVRKDASYEKEYLEGAYGAVPALQDVDRVVAGIVNEPKAGEE